MGVRQVCLAIGVAATACSPYGGGAFECIDNAQCGAGGTCEANGYCSFADVTCNSGRRYGDGSGPLAGICVGDEPPDAPSGPDGPVIDAFVVMDSDVCYGTGLVTVCLGAPATGTVVLTTGVIDTDASPQCAVIRGPSAGLVCAIVGDTIRITGGQSVTATGSRPLVLVAASTITVSGAIDVSSHRSPASIGAGGDAAACAAGTAATGGGGGQGGSFGGAGGNGGNGLGGVGGIAAAAQGATALRGGCAGANGGGGSPGGRGHGGGAVYLIAGGSISVDGTIAAAGSGGGGGVTGASGAGGGGSGGMIGFDAPTFGGGGSIFATGGGGGEGSGSTNTGDFGDDPTAPGTAAAGGAGLSGSGGDGGAGAAGAQPNGTSGGTGTNGGGGAGGGAGVIRVFGASTFAGQIAPPPT